MWKICNASRFHDIASDLGKYFNGLDDLLL